MRGSWLAVGRRARKRSRLVPEEPEQVGLRDPRPLLGDRLGGRGVVALLGEVTARDGDDLRAPLAGGLAAAMTRSSVSDCTQHSPRPDLDEDLLDRQREQRLRLRGLARHARRRRLRRPPVGDHRAPALKRPVRSAAGPPARSPGPPRRSRSGPARGHDERVRVHRGRSGRRAQALAELALGRADAMVGVEREAEDLDK